MNDKEWMLNPKAIRHAKDCIHIVKKELGFKLTLSHPDFVFLLHEYVDMLDSEELGLAYSQLIAMAGPGTVLRTLRPKDQNVIDLPIKKVVGDTISSAEESNLRDENETITSNGRVYPRWQEGKEFKGIYRGQPTYR